MKLRTILSKTVLTAAVALLIALPAHANIYGQSVTGNDLTDNRSFNSNSYDPINGSEGGLDGYWPGFNISWDISYDFSSTLWHYEYTLQNSKDISHMILEVSNTATAGDIQNFHYSDSGAAFQTGQIEGPTVWTKSGNITMPNSFYGVKFNVGGNPVVYSFDTHLDPVWGNFFAKDGKDGGDSVYAHNTGLNTSPFNSTDELDYIVRPDGGGNPPIVPEPISSTLFIAGGIAMIARRYLKK
ncbi:hypothetical protein H8E50_05725 [bacterium]|nr:hypothetical protein [bacterium]